MRTVVRRLVPVLLIVLALNGCAGSRLAAPPQLSPAGAVAFHGDRVVKGIGVLQEVVIAGEANGAIARNDARTVISATEVAGKAGEELAQDLRAGLSANGAKEKAIATIRQALSGLPKQLSAETNRIVTPYLSVVLTALAFLN